MATTQKDTKQNKEITSSPKVFSYLYECTILVFCILLYANSIPNDYNLDDELVTINHRLTSHGISAIPEIFTSNYYKDVSGYQYEYRPIVLVSFAIEHQIFGDNAHISHFINMLFYALCCALLLIVLRRLFKGYSPFFVFLIVLIYVAHPTHTEVVSSIKNRDEILALGFGLLSLLFTIRWLDSSKWHQLLLSILFTFIALLSKFTISPFCLAIPIILIFFHELSFRRLFVVAIAYILPVLVLLPFYALLTQLLFIAASMLGYMVMYGVKNLSLSDIKTWSVSLQPKRPSEPQLKEEKKKIELATPIENNSNNSRLLLILSASLSFILSTAAIYLFLRTSVYLSCIPVAGLAALYLLSNAQLKKIILPFLIISATVLTYFLQDRERIMGYAIASLLILGISATTDKYKRVYIALYAFTCVCLWPYEDIKLFFVLILLPSRWQKNIYLLGTLAILSLLLLVKPVISNFAIGEINEDLTLGMILLWPIYILIRKSVSIKKLSSALAITLPLLLALITYDEQHDTLLAFKPAPAKQYYNIKLADMKVRIKYRIEAFEDKMLSRTTTAKVVTGNAIKEQITNIKSTANDVKSGVSSNINAISTNIKTSAPLSFTQDIISKSKRPLTLIEQPISPTAPASIKIATGADLMARYIRLSVIPYPLCFYYGYSEIYPRHLSELWPLMSFVVIIISFFLSLYLFRKKELIGFAAFLFIFLMLPFCSFATPIAGVFADRFLFIPTLCFAIAIVRLLFWKKENHLFDPNLKWSSLPLYTKGAVGGICLVFGVLTIIRTGDWKDKTTLYRNDIKHLPHSAQAHNLLALQIMNSHEAAAPADKEKIALEALEHFKRSVAIYPGFFNTNYDLARTYVTLNQPDSAVYWFKKSTLIDPTFPDAYINIGDILFQLGRFPEAIPYLDTAIQQNPTDYFAYNRLSLLYFRQNRFAESIALNKIAADKIPAQAEPYLNVAKTYQAIQKYDSARIWYQKTMQVNPTNAEAAQLLNALPQK